MGNFTAAGYTYTVAQICENPGLNFKVYPNPTKDELNIYASGIENGDYTISITNMLGKKINSYEVNVTDKHLEKKISMQQLVSGIYLVTIQSESTKKTFKVEKL